MAASKSNLTEKQLARLNSKKGLKALFSYSKPHIGKALAEVDYLRQLKDLQVELIRLQSWVIENRKKVVVVFEGRDAAGKGGAIRRITEHINPRHFNIIALPIPTADEKEQWFFQRYNLHLPKPGEIVFFDRSWYNRAVVEPVNGFCSEAEYLAFMRHVNDFEKMLIDSNTHLIKLYFSITKEEQAKRFKDIQSNPLKRWKMTDVDRAAQGLWDRYTEYKQKMFEQTNSAHAPWTIIDANKKSKARLEAIQHILARIPYQQD